MGNDASCTRHDGNICSCIRAQDKVKAERYQGSRVPRLHPPATRRMATRMRTTKRRSRRPRTTTTRRMPLCTSTTGTSAATSATGSVRRHKGRAVAAAGRGARPSRRRRRCPRSRGRRWAAGSSRPSTCAQCTSNTIICMLQHKARMRLQYGRIQPYCLYARDAHDIWTCTAHESCGPV